METNLNKHFNGEDTQIATKHIQKNVQHHLQLRKYNLKPQCDPVHLSERLQFYKYNNKWQLKVLTMMQNWSSHPLLVGLQNVAADPGILLCVIDPDKRKHVSTQRPLCRYLL